MNHKVEEPVKRRRSSASRRVENAIRRQTLTGLSILSNFIQPLGLSSGRKEKAHSVFYESASPVSLSYADATSWAVSLEQTGDLDCESSLPLSDCASEAADAEVNTEAGTAANQPFPVEDGSCQHCQYFIYVSFTCFSVRESVLFLFRELFHLRFKSIYYSFILSLAFFS